MIVKVPTLSIAPPYWLAELFARVLSTIVIVPPKLLETPPPWKAALSAIVLSVTVIDARARGRAIVEDGPALVGRVAREGRSR